MTYVIIFQKEMSKMGIVSLIATVFCNSFKGFLSKKMSGIINTMTQNLSVNFLRSILCAVIAFCMIAVSGPGAMKCGIGPLVIFAICGICMAIFQYMWLYTVKIGAYMLVSGFSSASFILPAIGGILFLGEKLSGFDAIAIVSISVAVCFLIKYNGKTKYKMTPTSFLSLLSITVSQGLMQFLQKYYMSTFSNAEGQIYSFYVFLFASLFMGILLLFKKGGEDEKIQASKLGVSGFVVGLSVALFGATYFQTVAASYFPAILLYPILNVLSLVSGTLMSIFLFKERPNRDSITGIILVGVAMVMYSL